MLEFRQQGIFSHTVDKEDRKEVSYFLPFLSGYFKVKENGKTEFS